MLVITPRAKGLASSSCFILIEVDEVDVADSDSVEWCIPVGWRNAVASRGRPDGDVSHHVKMRKK